MKIIDLIMAGIGAVLYASLYLGTRSMLGSPVLFFPFISSPLIIYPLILFWALTVTEIIIVKKFSIGFALKIVVTALIVFAVFYVANKLFTMHTYETEFVFMYNPIMVSILFVIYKVPKYSYLLIMLSMVAGCIVIVAMLGVFYQGGGELEILVLFGFSVMGCVVGCVAGLLKELFIRLKAKYTEQKSKIE